MTNKEKALQLHAELQGKLSVISKKRLDTREILSLVYTPGVAEPCREIHANPESVYTYTIKSNTIAVVSDGSAVLGLGNIGPAAGIPVMEGKCALFKEFAGLDAFPLCLDTQDTEEIIRTTKNIAPVFGGINLEDISAPRCFEVETRLKAELDIPVFHDDQHGTAIVTLAAIINSLKYTGKKKEEILIVVNGAGSAGVAITKLLLLWGVKRFQMCDRAGILSPDNAGLNSSKMEIARLINPACKKGSIRDALVGADYFVGVSGPNCIDASAVRLMAPGACIFAMSNPDPEIHPDEAEKGGAVLVATGRSDFPNQINNVLAFPGIFRGALAVRSRVISDGMKLAAAEAIAGMVSPSDIRNKKIVPSPLEADVAFNVAVAVAETAMRQGTAKLPLGTDELRLKIRNAIQGK